MNCHKILGLRALCAAYVDNGGSSAAGSRVLLVVAHALAAKRIANHFSPKLIDNRRCRRWVSVKAPSCPPRHSQARGTPGCQSGVPERARSPAEYRHRPRPRGIAAQSRSGFPPRSRNACRRTPGAQRSSPTHGSRTGIGSPRPPDPSFCRRGRRFLAPCPRLSSACACTASRKSRHQPVQSSSRETESNPS